MVLYFDMTRTKRNHAKPRERFERSTPSLQDLTPELTRLSMIEEE